MSPSNRLLVLLFAVCSLISTPVVGDNNELKTSTTIPKIAAATTPIPSSSTLNANMVVDKAFPDNIVDWNVTNTSTNLTLTCIKFKGGIQLTFNYNTTTNEPKVKTIQEFNKTASGKCGTSNQTLVVTWPSDNKTEFNTMIFTFEKMDNDTKVFLKTVNAKVIINVQPNASLVTDFKSFDLNFVNFTNLLNPAPINSSYKCNSPLKFPGNASNSTLEFGNLQVQAYRSTNSTDFSGNDVLVCSADSGNNSNAGGLSGWTVTIIIFLIFGGIGLGGFAYHYYKKYRLNHPSGQYVNM